MPRRQLLVEALDSISVGIVVLDADGLVKSWNAAAARLTAIDAADALGEPFALRTGTSDAPAELAIDDRTLEITEAPLPGGGSVVELHDTTRARDLIAARTMFLASTSHQLKTPLTAISGFARWLQAHPEERPERATAVDAIVASADELRDLVEKILLSARTESMAGDLVVERTDVVPLLTAIAEQFAVPESKHPLIVEVEDPGMTVMCDRRAMRTALGQLVENAMKYSPDGGDVILGAARAESGDVEISVKDHGIGFGRGDADFLFVAFYQGDRPGKGGVGLGLSIVRRLIEAQGGTVTATGSPGEGATFTMTMPAAPGDS